MSTTDPGTFIDDLVVRGIDDWVMAADVAWTIKVGLGSSSEEHLLETSLCVVRAVLGHGLMEIGDVTDQGFVPWDLSPDDAMVRVEREWRELEQSPDLGEICWLANTDLGDQRAASVLSRRTK